MLRSIMTAALILSLSLTAAGCGANNNASTAAHRWNDGVNNAQTQQNLARGAGAAARGVGDAVEDALDGMTGTNNNNNNNTNPAANSGINAGNSVNPPVNNTNRTTNNGTTAK